MKKTLSVILTFLMLIGIPVTASYAADDVPEGYTGIYDIEDLYMIRNDLGGNYILMNDIDLTADLADGGDWNEGMGWTPIGISSTGCEPFTGIFDGNGHTLTGFRINITSINSGYTGDYYAGLFGINEGTIKNTVFENASFNNKYGNVKYTLYGGIVAGGNYGEIIECNVDTISVIDAGFSLYDYSSFNRSIIRSCGIIAGYSNGLIDNCRVSGNQTLYRSDCNEENLRTLTVAGTNYCGNIVGFADSDSTTKNCISKVQNYVNLILSSATIYYGGIIGRSLGVVQRCCSYGSMEIYAYGSNASTGSTYKCDCYCGGISGYQFEGKVQDCYSYVTGLYGGNKGNGMNGWGETYIGGISGVAWTSNISNVYAAGLITGSYVGGVAGRTNDPHTTITNAYYIDTYTKGVSNGTDTCASKTSTILKKQGAYTGFDFESVWIMYPCSGYKYAQLRSNPQDTSSDDHSCKNPITNIEATCTEDGIFRGLCDNCGKEFTINTPALGHDFAEEYTVDKEPTCTAEGSKSQHCSRCDEKQNITVISAKGHDFSAWEPTVESTSCEEGTMKRVCSECQLEETKSYSAAEHIPVTDSAVEPTCTETGLTEGSHCRVCGKVFVEQEIIPAKGHALTHHDGKAPTCEKAGFAPYDTCSNCDYNTYKTLQANGHTPAQAIKENEKAPTCTAGGNYESVIYCSECSKELSRETVKTNPTGHIKTETVAENRKEATCTEGGCYDKAVYCSDCKQMIGKETVMIPALGHSFTNYKYNNDATTERDGTETAKCDRCDVTDTRIKHGTKTADPLSQARINTGKSKTVDYRSKVTVSASAANVPEGYYLAVYEGSSLRAKGDNKSVSYYAGEMTADRLFTVKIVDAAGNAAGDNLQQDVRVNVKSGFFDRIIAFFRGLFGLLPAVEIKP